MAKKELSPEEIEELLNKLDTLDNAESQKLLEEHPELIHAAYVRDMERRKETLEGTPGEV